MTTNSDAASVHPSRRAAVGLLAALSVWALYMAWMMTAVAVSERHFFGSLAVAALVGVGAWFVVRKTVADVSVRLAVAIGATAAALTLRVFVGVIGIV